MIKTLLIKPPPSLHPRKEKLNLELLAPSLGLAYIAAVLEKNNFPVAIIDAPAQHFYQTEIFRFIKKYQPQVIGLTAITQEFPIVSRLAKNIRKRFKNITLIIGGPHASVAPNEVLETGIFDFVVLGEGERTMLNLIKESEKPKPDYVKVKGIGFSHKGKVFYTSPAPRIKNIDLIPFPARHLMPSLEAYQPSPGVYRNLPLASIITSRGCPFQCTFCARNVFGNVLRLRNPKNVVEEMEILVKNYGAKEIRLWDDTFNIDPDRVIEICRLILERKLNFTWTCQGRVNFANRKMLGWMKKTGCWQISYGIESGNQSILDRIQKGTTLSMIRKAVETTHQVGIEIKGFFMLGLPGETKETMQQTIDFAKSLPLDIATFTLLTPFPGTKILTESLKTGEFKGRSYQNYIPYETKKPAFVAKGLSVKQLLTARKSAYRQFYFRPRKIAEELLKVRSPKILRLKFRGLTAVFKNLLC